MKTFVSRIRRGLERRLRALWHDEARAAEIAGAALVTAQIKRGAPSLEPSKEEFGIGVWELIGGEGKGWPPNTYYKARGLAIDRGILYAGLTGPAQQGPHAGVWQFAEGLWHRIGGDLQTPWPANPAFLDHLAHFNGEIFAAIAGRLWKLSSGIWSEVADPLPISGVSGPYAIVPFKGRLAVSVWGDPAVLLVDAGRCERLPEPPGGWGERVRTVYCLVEYQSQLYAGTGTGRFVGQSSSVFRFDGRSWEKVGGDGLRGSWTQPGIPFVLSLTVFGGHLIATLSRPASTPSAASNVWAFDGDEWRPIATGNTPALMAQSLIMNDAIVYNGHLLVATGDSRHDNVAVWRLDREQRWQNISGDAFETVHSPHDGGTWIYRLCTDGQNLYASTAGHQGAARVYRWKPTQAVGFHTVSSNSG